MVGDSPHHRRVSRSDDERSCIVRRAARVSVSKSTRVGVTRRLAFLVLDSDDGRSLIGARAASARPRRLLFESGLASIDFEIRQCAGRKLAITGQLQGPASAAYSQARLSSGNQAMNAAVDDLGVFEFGPMAGGEYALSIELGDSVLEIPSLVI